MCSSFLFQCSTSWIHSCLSWSWSSQVSGSHNFFKTWIPKLPWVVWRRLYNSSLLFNVLEHAWMIICLHFEMPKSCGSLWFIIFANKGLSISTYALGLCQCIPFALDLLPSLFGFHNTLSTSFKFCHSWQLHCICDGQFFKVCC
jgi:hypothetical protein